MNFYKFSNLLERAKKRNAKALSIRVLLLSLLSSQTLNLSAELHHFNPIQKSSYLTEHNFDYLHFTPQVAAFGDSAKKNCVVLISIDGLRPEFYMDASWGMVNLRREMSRGAYARGVRGSCPSLTFPSHTTILTGSLPDKHGIHYNSPVEPEGVTGKLLWYHKDIKVPTLWHVIRAAGLVSANVYWPVTVGAPIDYNLPEYALLTTEGTVKKDELKGLEAAANPKELFQQIQKYAIGKFAENGATLEGNVGDENKSRMAGFIIKRYKPNFLAVHFARTDYFQHRQGREGDGVRSAVQAVDVAIKNIIDAVHSAGLSENTTFIITGDHGFIDIHTQVKPNVLLAKMGLYDPASRETWKAYFQPAGGSAFLYLKNSGDSSTIKKVRQGLQALPEGIKRMFRVVDRGALKALHADTTAALALAGNMGFSFSSAAEGDLLVPVSGGMHGYFPEDFKEIQTGFVAFGKAIKPGAVLAVMGQEDIAPLIAKLLNLKMETQGILYPGLLAP